MKHFRLLFLLFFIFSSGALSAQILNDSTRNVYNPTTTRIFRENDFLRGNYQTRVIDTTLNNMNQYRNWFHDTTFHQDLGNMGTAAKPILWRFPTRIGARFGKNVFDRYMYDPYQIDYFDTKSPYTHLIYVQGGQGEQVFEGKHVRSFKNLASIGVSFQRMASNKQIGLGPTRDEGQVDNLAVTVFSHIQNKSGRYHLFTNYINFNHEVIESGGIRAGSANTAQDSLFLYEDAPVWLNNAANVEKRNSFHLTQTLQLAKEYIKVYHTTDYRQQYNKFFDNVLDTMNLVRRGSPVYYPVFRLDSTNTDDRSLYKEWEHTVGITGNHPLFFYNVYAKRRDASLELDARSTFPDSLQVSQIKRKFGQNFIGGETQFKLKDIFNITARGQYQLFSDYLAQVSAKVKFLTVSQTRSSYSPSLQQQFYTSNNYYWNNDLENIVADRTAAEINGRFFRNTVQLEVARVNLQNYVIYSSENLGQPRQLSKQLSFISARLHHQFNIRSIYFDHVVAYNNTADAPEIRMPDWIVNSKIYFQGSLFKKALFGQAGIETYLTDNYFADAYMPALQQFYLQNNFEVKTYPVVDVFITADIKSFNVFVKLAHANQGFPKDGYFTTPYYSGMPRSFVFGLKWMFFD